MAEGGQNRSKIHPSLTASKPPGKGRDAPTKQPKTRSTAASSLSVQERRIGRVYIADPRRDALAWHPDKSHELHFIKTKPDGQLSDGRPCMIFGSVGIAPDETRHLVFPLTKAEERERSPKYGFPLSRQEGYVHGRGLKKGWVLTGDPFGFGANCLLRPDGDAFTDVSDIRRAVTGADANRA